MSQPVTYPRLMRALDESDALATAAAQETEDLNRQHLLLALAQIKANQAQAMGAYLSATK